MTLKRIIINAKDIEILTGRSERYARKVLHDIRHKHNKQKHQVISLGELCQYLGIPEEEAIAQLALVDKRFPK